jgi:hypothetical protein
MPAEARITPIWKKQKLFVAIILLGFSLPFYYDGFTGYEQKNARYREWKVFVDEGREAEWPAYAASRDWKADEWTKFVKDHGNRMPEIPFPRGKIIEQFVCAGLTTIFGLITLAYWFGQKGRILRTDDEAVYTPAGTRVPFTAITGIGKKKWEAKGLATVRYEIEGRKGEFILDDYKFDRDPTHAILEEIEKHLTAPGA